MIRLIAIDIDGTLLDHTGRIPDENRRAIAEALDRGIEVALVTGRGFTFAQPVAERLGLPVVIVASNGAIVRRLDGTTVLRRLMPREVARHVLEADGCVPRRGRGRVRSAGGRSARLGRARLDAPVAGGLLRPLRCADLGDAAARGLPSARTRSR